MRGSYRQDGLRASMSFPSAEWATTFRAALNANVGYREAAAAWEGDILLVVRKSDGPSPGILLRLAHGTCSEATFHPDAGAVASEFAFEGTSEDWSRILRRDVDPIQALLHGIIKVRGNPAKLMRFTRAAKELVDTAAAMPP